MPRRMSWGMSWGAHDPNADAAVSPFAAHLEARERPDDPPLELVHIAAHILSAPAQVQHNIGDALAGPVIGIAAATPGTINRQAPWLEQLLLTRAGPGCVKRRMLE